MADLSVTGEVVVTSEKAEAAFDRVGDKATQMANEVASAAGKAGQAVDGVGAGAEKSADKFTRAESRMRDAIKRSTQELQLLGKTASEKLEFNINAKGLDASKFAPYIEELKKAEAAQRIATGSLDKMGISAAQTAAALRGVPAQFTDIITSLQGGQAPLTVFLQQGGQLKDMFGGAGAAARALGGYVAGLINPFTLAAAGAAALAVAYNQGSKEADAYRLAIVSTGNAVGTTGAQLKGYAQEISSVVGTQGKAAESLAAFVSTGRVSRDVLKEASQAAIEWERATGQAVGATAKQFADLGKDPLQAVLKLNEGTNFLTESVYRQIKSLDEQGRTAEAAAVAQRAYADALTGRSATITQNLGYIEAAWKGITDAAKKSWDAMLNIGRASTPADATAELRTRLSRQQEELAAKKAINPYADTSGMEKGIELLKQRLGLLESDERQARRLADAEAARADQMKGLAQWEKEGDQFKQKSAKRNEEINKAEVEGRALIAAGLIKEADLRERIAGIREKYKESGAAGTGESEVAAILARNEQAAKYLERLRAQIAGQGALTDVVKPTQNEELAAKLQKELETSIKGVARAQKEKALAAAQAGIQTDKDIAAAEKQKKALIDLQNIMDKQVDAVQKQADAIRDQAVGQEAVNANFGKSKTAIEQATLAQLKLQLAEADSSDRFAPAYIAALDAKTKAQGRYVEALQKAEYLQANQKLDEAARSAQEETVSMQLQMSLLGMSQVEREKIIAQRQVEVQLAKELADIEKLNLGEGPEAAAKREELRAKARANAVIAGNNAAAKVVVAEWDRTADQINQSLTDALLRGFESGKDFAKNMRDTVVNMFKTMVLRPVISAVMSPVAGAINGMLYGNAAAAAGGGANALGMIGSGANLITGLQGTQGMLGTVGGWLGMNTAAANAGLAATIGIDAASATAAANGAAAAGSSGFMSTVGAAMPWIAGAAAIMSIVSSLDDSGTPHTGAGAIYREGKVKGGADLYGSGAFNMGHRDEYNSKMQEGISGIATGIGMSLDAVAVTFGKKAGYEVATAFADDSSGDGAWGSLRISKDGQDILDWRDTQTSRWAPKEFGDGEEGYKEYLAAVAKDTRQVLLDMDLPSWADKMLTDIGDSASMESLPNVIAQINATQATFDDLGKALTGFAAYSDEAKYALVELSGGLDAFRANAQAYYQNFYSPEEQRANLERQLQSQFDKLNITMPDFRADDARAQFRALMEAQDSTTEEGRKVIAMLFELSGAFSQLATVGDTIAATRASLQDRLDALQGNDRAILDRQRKAEFDALYKLDPALAALVSQIYELEDAARAAADAEAARVAAIDKSLRNLQAAYDRERKVLEAQLDGIDQARTYFQEQQSLASESLGLITGVFDLLHDSVQNLYGDVEAAAAMQAEQGRAFIAQALATAVTTGYLPEQDQLSEAIRAAVAGVNSGTYANTTEQDFAKLVLAGQLRALEEVTGKQKTDAEKQLDALEKQLKSLDDQTDAIEKQLKLQQESLDYWQEQIDIANGVYDATLSVEQAVRDLAALLGAEVVDNPPEPANGGGSGGGGAVFGGGSGSNPTPAPARYSRLIYGGTAGVGYEAIRDQSLIDRLDKLSPVYHSFDGTGDLAGLAAAMKAAGGTIADLSILSGNWASDWRNAFAGVGIPAFAVGTNYVPRDMVAQIHEGEAIVPKAFNPWANGGSMGSDNTALIAELRALRAEVAELRTAAEETAGATGATADVLVRVTQNGNGMVTAAAPI